MNLGVIKTNKERIEYFSHLALLILLSIFSAYLFIRFILLAILPFLIAWTVAFSVRPMAARFSEAAKLPKRVVSAIIGTVSILCILTLTVGIVIYALSEAWDLLSRLNEDKEIYEILKRLLNPLEIFFENQEGSEELKNQISSAISSALSGALSSIVSFLTGFVSSVPRVVIFIIVTSLSTVYFCVDLERVNAAVKSILPKRASLWLTEFKDRFLLTMLKYLRSYLFLMLFTFVIMIFGFMIMKIPFAIMLAFLVALLDALPLIGIGTVLLPWGVFEMLFGSFSRGVGLFILFGVAWLLRQLLEPKIVGKNLGVHPLISLVLLYIGYSFFGFFGLLCVPLGVVILEILLKKDEKIK